MDVPPDRLVFLVTVDGCEARVVLYPMAKDPDRILLVEVRGPDDGVGCASWQPLLYCDTKRFIAAALLYTSVFGARPGEASEVGRVERNKHILPPPACAALMRRFFEGDERPREANGDWRRLLIGAEPRTEKT